MKSTFFDFLMISDVERIHTQTLAWILNLDISIFSNEEKAKFLKTLFNIEAEFEITDELYVETEFNKIDLFIQTSDSQFIIENKLKSSEHDSQTYIYINEIPDQFLNQNKQQYFGFLSLINEKAENSEWVQISFENLRDALSEIEWNQNINESIFITEYIGTLDNLVFVFNSFMNNHMLFPNVFQDGSKKKFDKKPYEDLLQDYIRKNQLETIFQKAFLIGIINEIEIDVDEINETRGTALFQIFFDEIEINGKTFKIGFQFQGRTIKINFQREDYNSSKDEEMTESMISIFSHSYHKKNGYSRLNRPTSKAYVSVSKTLSKELFEYKQEELISLLRREIGFVKGELNQFKAEF